MKEFVKEHSIRILDDNKRASRYYKVNLNFFKKANDYNYVESDILQHETEPLYTVEIAESELQRIADFESQVFNNMRTRGHQNMFEVLMEQKEEEQQLRRKYSAVQKSYEQYSMMLKLAQSGEL